MNWDLSMRVQICNKWALVQVMVMAWHQAGSKSLPDPMVTLFTDVHHNNIVSAKILAIKSLTKTMFAFW